MKVSTLPIIFIFVMLVSLGSVEVAGSTQKKVLIFSSDGIRLASGVIYEQSLRNAFSKKGLNVHFYEEALDDWVIPHTGFELEELDLLQKKYEGEKLDCIFVVGMPAFQFLLKYENELFTDVPKVYAFLDDRSLTGLDIPDNATGVAGKFDPVPTLELILSLHPKTRNIAVVTGSAPVDHALLELSRKDIDTFTGRVNIQYLSDLTIDELKNATASLPPDTVIYFLSLGKDRDGNAFGYPMAVSFIAPTANAPIYGSVDSGLGTGIVGGNVISFEERGKIGAEMVVRIVNGENPESIPHVSTPSVPMFDWRQLQRWNIAAETLPAGSVIRFREPTAWEQYRDYIVAALAILLIQSFLIGAFLIARARRRIAESERNEFQALAAAEHERLNEVVLNVPGIVWESRVIDETGRRRAAFVSGHVEQMLGYSVEECLADPDFIRSKIVPEHREIYQRDVDAVFSSGNPTTIQFKCMIKNGGTKWVESVIIPVRDESGKTIGLRGVTLDITDRKKAEEQLGTKEQQLVEAQRVAQVGSWEWDRETGTVVWSEEIYRIYGMDSTMRPASFEEHQKLYTPESWKHLEDAVTEALKHGTPYEVELEIIRTDGQPCWGCARGELVKNDEKVNLRGTLQDITERKIAEEAIRESEARFRNMADTAPVFIWIANPQMQCTYFNRKCLDFTGRSMDELRGRGWLELIHKDDAGRCEIAYSAGCERHEPFFLEYRMRAADGEYRWFYDIGSPQFSSTGEFLGYIGSAVDITELKAAGEAMLESETRFRNMADTAPVKLWMSDVNMDMTFVNQYFLRFTGLTMERLLGDGWLQLIHSDDREHYLTAFNSARENRQRFNIEFRIRRSDGEYRWAYGTATPRFSSDGQFLGYIGSLVDISDRKTAEEGLRAALEQIYNLKNQLHEENVYLKEVIKLDHHFEEIIGSSDELKYVLFKIEQVAPTDSTVLITGETGTGKELVARAIHKTSLRSDRPLVKVNCAALASGIIESELFGHERGAFTGASSRKIGRFELADGATIFLDEVGELPLELQAKLLRMIQEGEFERLGSSTTLKADVRIMAATNRNLEAEVRAGRFREDLLFRLNVFPVTVPPLRERKEDIGELVEHFVSQFSKKLGKTITSISPATLRNLTQYHWPGNVRELANVIERAVIGTRGDTLSVAEQLGDHKHVEDRNGAEDRNGHDLPESLASVERKHIIKTLLSTGWRIEGPNGAARILGVNPSTLRTRMSKLGIVKNDSHVVLD